ncbi:MAG TPA: hypothetical protein VFR78_18915 [Pyrinomonadaceae bacterium]|nr:hypothetical protein [Pyrinomonadaceae bacterium]
MKLFLVNRRDLALCVLLFAFTYSIFILSPVQQPADSLYSMMVSQSIIERGTVALDDYKFPDLTPIQSKKFHSNSSIYHLDLIDGHVYYYYGPGSSILSVPYVAIMNAFGVYASREDGTHDPAGEMRIQTGLAALLMAALAVVFFLTSRIVLPVSWSVAIAMGGTLGTQVFSTATRALWAHTWMIFLLGFVVLLLVGRELKGWHLRPVVLASLLSWMFFVRPTAIVPIVVISVYLGVFYRDVFVRYALTGAAWLLLFVIYSWHNFGQLLPNYYRLGAQLRTHSIWVAMLGNLVSPSRGVFVFVPSLMFVGYLLVRYWKYVQSRRLVGVSLTVLVLHLILVSSFPIWWAGFSFGPRFLTDVVPWFVLLAIMGVQAMLIAGEQRAPVYKSADVVVGMVLLAASIFIHARGANSPATQMWNVRPVSVDERPERLWDWRDPQFMARD